MPARRARASASCRPPCRSASRHAQRGNESEGERHDRREREAEEEDGAVHARSRSPWEVPAGSARRSRARRTAPTISPAAPPSIASRRLSVSSWRTMRVRPAPSAARIANSPWRCTPRASRRFITFTQAMTSTRITAPSTAKRAGRTPRVISSWSGVSALDRMPEGLWMLHHERPRDAVQVLAGELEARARAQPSDGVEVVAPRAPLGHVVLERSPERRLGRRHVHEPGRHDADHHVAAVVERDRSSDDGGIAVEAAPPERIAQDHDRGSVQAVVGCAQFASERGRHAQHAEITRAHALPFEPLGLAAAGDRRLPRLHHRDRVERCDCANRARRRWRRCPSVRAAARRRPQIVTIRSAWG